MTMAAPETPCLDLCCGDRQWLRAQLPMATPRPWLTWWGTRAGPPLWRGGFLWWCLPFDNASSAQTNLSQSCPTDPALLPSLPSFPSPFTGVRPASHLKVLVSFSIYTSSSFTGLSPHKCLVCLTVSWHLLLEGSNYHSVHQQENGWNQCVTPWMSQTYECHPDKSQKYNVDWKKHSAEARCKSLPAH